MYSSSISERIKYVLRENNSSINAISSNKSEQRRLNRQINEGATVTCETISSILKLFPKYDANWLLSGEGEMLKNQEAPEVKGVKLVDNNYLFERLEYLAKANGILEERNKTLENELEQMKSHSSRNVGTSSYSIESEVKNVAKPE